MLPQVYCLKSQHAQRDTITRKTSSAILKFTICSAKTYLKPLIAKEMWKKTDWNMRSVLQRPQYYHKVLDHLQAQWRPRSIKGTWRESAMVFLFYLVSHVCNFFSKISACLQIHDGVMNEMETLSASLALCERNPPVTGGFPSQRASNVDPGCFFDVIPNCGINGQVTGLRRCDAHVITVMISRQSALLYQTRRSRADIGYIICLLNKTRPRVKNVSSSQHLCT